MDRVYQSNGVETPPATISSSGSYPSSGNKAVGQLATVPGAYWFYMVTEEIRNAILASGLTPDPAKVNQLGEAFAKFLPLTGGVLTGDLGLSSSALSNVSRIEVTPKRGSGGGYVDFHYSGDTSVEYTSRIIESERGKLNFVTPNGVNVNSQPITRLVMPNYNAGVSKTWGSNITAEADGEVIANSYSGAYETVQVEVNNVKLPFNEVAHNGRMGVTFLVAKGDVYRVYGGNGDGSGVITFYPLRGA